MGKKSYGNRSSRNKAISIVKKGHTVGGKFFAGDVCHLCNKKIDLYLPAGLPSSFEVDDIVPVSKGGNPTDPQNLLPSHKSCNASRGDLHIDIIYRNLAGAKLKTSRIW